MAVRIFMKKEWKKDIRTKEKPYPTNQDVKEEADEILKVRIKLEQILSLYFTCSVVAMSTSS